MKYGLISDIHGNLEALKAVLGALAEEDPDAYLCIGDIVGYGANPKECIEIVRSLKPEVSIAGNHEWGVLGSLDLDYFSEYAREAINWTKNILSPGEIKYFKSLQLVGSGKNMTLVHGSLEDPKEFYYIFDAAGAEGTIKLLKTQLCFVGHSHVPGIFCFDGRIFSAIGGFRAKLAPDKKYVINIGSVGQPRDGDPRASFAVYDESEGSVEIRRVSYDIEEAQRKILRAGLPMSLASRLSEGH